MVCGVTSDGHFLTGQHLLQRLSQLDDGLELRLLVLVVGLEQDVGDLVPTQRATGRRRRRRRMGMMMMRMVRMMLLMMMLLMIMMRMVMMMLIVDNDGHRHRHRQWSDRSMARHHVSVR